MDNVVHCKKIGLEFGIVRMNVMEDVDGVEPVQVIDQLDHRVVVVVNVILDAVKMVNVSIKNETGLEFIIVHLNAEEDG